MNAAEFSLVFDRVCHGGTVRPQEIESVLADCARLREAIADFARRCQLGATTFEVTALLLVLEGAPFLGTPTQALSRRANNGRPQARTLDGKKAP